MDQNLKYIGIKTYSEDRHHDDNGNSVQVEIEETAFRKTGSSLVHLVRNCIDSNGKHWQENIAVNNWEEEKGGHPDDAETSEGKGDSQQDQTEKSKKGKQSKRNKSDQKKSKAQKEKNNGKSVGDWCSECSDILSQSDIDNGECSSCGADLSGQEKEENDNCDNCGESLSKKEIKQGHCDNRGETIKQNKSDSKGRGQGQGQGQGQGERNGEPPEPVFTSFEKYIMLLIFAEPKRWTQYAYARDRAGLSLVKENKNTLKIAAVSLDAAMDRVFNETRHNILSKNLKQHFDSLFKKNRKNKDLQKVNDSLMDHKDLIHLLCMLPVIDKENDGIFPIDEKMDQEIYLSLIERYKNSTLEGYAEQIKNPKKNSSDLNNNDPFWSDLKPKTS